MDDWSKLDYYRFCLFQKQVQATVRGCFYGLGFRVLGLEGLGFGVWGFMVQGLAFRIEKFGGALHSGLAYVGFRV